MKLSKVKSIIDALRASAVSLAHALGGVAPRRTWMHSVYLTSFFVLGWFACKYVNDIRIQWYAVTALAIFCIGAVYSVDNNDNGSNMTSDSEAK